MPARSIVYPTADHATFRDLNIFEERLKENAASLQRRKSRYQLFLAQLLVAIALLLVEVILPPDVSIVSIPYNALLRWLLPDIYAPDTFVILNPYFTTGLLFVNVTTLVLFFASGMYSEKIAYANKYVPHTNRTLRSFNMYFNTRKPPLRSQVLWNPLAFFFPRPTSPGPSGPNRSPSPSPSPSQEQTSLSSGHARSQSGSKPIPSIPPAANPRGELIFSSRVDKSFREGYDRYRLAFEKKREESIRRVNEQKRMERWWWVYQLRFWAPAPSPPSPRPSSTAAGADASIAPGFSRNNSQSSSRGRGTPRSGTPPSTPGSNSSMRQRDRSGSPMSRQQPLRSSGGGQRRNPLNRRVTPDGSSSGGSNPNLDRGGGSVSSTGRRELGEEGDMRVRALERSFAQGSPNSSSSPGP